MLAVLNSNDGDRDLTLNLESSAITAGVVGFKASIAVRTVHWEGGHKHPAVASIKDMWLRAAAIEDLRTHILAWLAQPLDRLTPDRLDGSFELAGQFGQSLAIAFGDRADTISSGKPVVSVSLDAGWFHCTFHFVTDQSCLSIFVNGLNAEANSPQHRG